MFMRNLLVAGVLGLAVMPVVRGQACELDARNKSNIAQPVIGPGEMDAELEKQVRDGFNLLYGKLDPAAAEKVLMAAQQAAELKQNVCGEALATWGMAQSARQIRLPDALPRYHRAEELFRKLGAPMALAHAHSLIGIVEQTTGDQAGAERDIAPVPEEFEKAGDIANAVNNRAYLLQWQTNVDRVAGAEAMWKELEDVKAPNVPSVAGLVMLEWGNFLRDDGKLAPAMVRFKQGLEILKECQCALGLQGGIGLSMSTTAATMGDLDSAIEYAAETDKIFADRHADGLRVLSQRALGLAEMMTPDYPKAIVAFELGLKLAKEQHVGSQIPELTALLSVSYSENGEPLKGLAMLDANPPVNYRPAQLCAYDRSVVLVARVAKLYSRADPMLAAADKDCVDQLAPDKEAEFEVLHAEVARDEGQLEVALQHVLKAIDGFDTVRSSIEFTDKRMAQYNVLSGDYYALLIDVLSRLGRPEDALLASEQYRARAFVDLATSPRLEPVAAASGTVELTNPAQEGALPTRGGAKVKESAALDLMSQPHPFLLTAAAMRKIVEEQHATLVSYWVTPEKLTTWVMVPGKPVFEATQAITAAKLNALVAATLPAASAGTRGAADVATRSGESQAVGRGDRKAWRELYDVLIAPIEAQLPAERGSLLTIVPQFALFRVSFPALMNARGEYLIERYAIHTTPSVGVLQVTEANERAAVALPQRYLLVANPELFPQVNGHALPALPGTAVEVREIAQTLGKRSQERLEGRQAGIETMEQSLGSATVLHLATHAVVSDDAPLTSFLALDRRQQGGMLTAASVYGLKLHTNLVVLSACGTGRGKISGDGVAGLSRAFFYAGAASLVTTLWDVVDTPTAELMPRFYAGMAKGESRSAALRGAQLALIGDLRAHKVRVKTLSGTTVALPENPVYWAAFSLAGQP